ncbi:glutaredoxin family protein [Methylomarinum vadi]|uniref:glutaredoxin family protein n=1 Tax=Methylomarinum vadi TaxID=438855 RepID=UPI00068BDABF|nr:thioredoxin family protein [Methylomarinum vadi]
MNSNTESLTYKAILAFICALLDVSLLPAPAQAEINGLTGGKAVDLYYFWSRYCPHCREAKPFIESLPKKYAWLNVHSYDLVGNRANQQRYLTMAEQLGQQAKSVPAFIYCGQMMVGFDRADSTGQQLEKKLLECYRQHSRPLTELPQQFTLPGLGQVHYQDFSLPVFTLIIAALDAFNPCAFFVLFFLLSLMVHHRSRIRMLTVGTTFVACSGIMYFLFMAAWLNLFLITEELMFITAIAGLVAFTFGLINIKDFFFFQQGVSLSLSDSAKNKLFARIRSLSQTGSWPTMILATLVLAVAANSYELLCTAGLPMVFTRVLTLNELNVTQYYLYLFFYNLIYVIPLLMIVFVFTMTLGSKKLSEQEGRLLKLLSGSMMLGLGTILLLKPEWLSDMSVSVSVIFAAILFTALVALLEKLKKNQAHGS